MSGNIWLLMVTKGNMDGVGFGSVCVLLLLIQCGNGADLVITSPDRSPLIRIGDPINLNISYSAAPSSIMWTANDGLVVLWILGGQQYIAAGYQNRLTVKEKSLSINGSTKADSGAYKVTVNDTNNDSGFFVFTVVVRDTTQEIQSNDTGIYKTGDNISLSISYEGNPLGIFWNYNSSPLIISTPGYSFISPRVNGRTILKNDGSLLIYNTTKEDAGNYTISVTTSIVPGLRSFQVTFYDLVNNVTVTQSPQIVSENTSLVNLSCIALSGYIGAVTWMKDGQSINSTYNLLNGNQTLQIIQPNRAFSGNYRCNISNPVSWGSGSHQLRVYDPVKNVTVTPSPQTVSENTSLVNLSCIVSSGYVEAVTWMKDGQSINSTYNLLDGNQTLQISQPNRTFSGNYSCNISNAAYWSFGIHQLRVYDPVKNVTVTQSPQTVSENTSLVNLSCIASSGYVEAVTWMKDGQSINITYNLLDGNRTFQIILPNRTFSGNYSCNISNAVYSGFVIHQLRVYDPVKNVTVTQSPMSVGNTSPLVKLTCNSSSGYIEEVTWTKDGQSVISNNAYSLLDGNRTLQITKPNVTFNGIYTCNMSNAAYSGLGSLTLTISYAPLGASSTFVVIITSLLGGILLAH